MKQKKIDKEVPLAYHEAGHAVISLLAGAFCFPIKEITISSLSGGGHVESSGYGHIILHETGNQEDYRRCRKFVDWHLKITAAGVVATLIRNLLNFKDIKEVKQDILKDHHTYTTLYVEKFNEWHTVPELKNEKSDKFDFDFICDRFYKRKNKDKVYYDIFNSTEKLLMKNWELVEYIADRLLDKKTLNQDEVNKISHEFSLK